MWTSHIFQCFKHRVPTWSRLQPWRSPPHCLWTWHWSPRWQGRAELEQASTRSPQRPHPEHLSTTVGTTYYNADKHHTVWQSCNPMENQHLTFKTCSFRPWLWLFISYWHLFFTCNVKHDMPFLFEQRSACTSYVCSLTHHSLAQTKQVATHWLSSFINSWKKKCRSLVLNRVCWLDSTFQNLHCDWPTQGSFTHRVSMRDQSEEFFSLIVISHRDRNHLCQPKQLQPFFKKTELSSSLVNWTGLNVKSPSVDKSRWLS